MARWYAVEMESLSNEINVILEEISSLADSLNDKISPIKTDEGWDKVTDVKTAIDDMQAIIDSIKQKKSAITSSCHTNVEAAKRKDDKTWDQFNYIDGTYYGDDYVKALLEKPTQVWNYRLDREGAKSNYYKYL